MNREEGNVKCLQCGQPITGSDQMNRMPDGSNCKICAMRMLDALPSLIPSSVKADVPRELAPILQFPQKKDWDAPEPA